MKECILVTGGCGFIGSNFVRYLLGNTKDLAVVNFDQLTYAGNLENLADVAKDPRYHFIRGDITDRGAVENALRVHAITSIVHFAAESHVDRSILDSSPFVQTNIVGTQILLDAARKFKLQRYVQVSTDEVYGSLGTEGFFTEETPLAPNSPYSASKAASDLLVRSYVHTFNFPGITTRCSNNYGPYQYPEKMIPLFISRLMKNETVPVYGDGLQIRDWLHVQDHCQAIFQVWAKGKAGEVYNIGGENELTNMQLTRTLLGILDKPETLIRHVADRPGHDRRYAIDCSKIKRDIGWSPKITFETGLKQTVEWYHKHEDWVRRIQNGEYLKYWNQQYGKVA